MDAQHLATFGDTLRELRHKAALSRADLAARSGLSIRRIAQLERETAPALPEGTLLVLAEALSLQGADRETFLSGVLDDILVQEPDTAASERGLPRQLVPLIGRDDAIEKLVDLVQRDDVSIITMTGPGGVGKTSLALAVAHRLVGVFGEAVTYVPLAPVLTARYVPFVLSEALGIPYRRGDLLDGVMKHLQRSRHLLVIDNFEHVLDAAPFISRLVASCPDVTVMVTSRERLNLRGEHVWKVEPLRLPKQVAPPSIDAVSDFPAVELFVQRACEVDPGFHITPKNAQAVLDICRRLDGLPLALELAAGWVSVLPPAEILARLDHRLELLAHGARDAPVRHQTLRDTVQWSYSLLSEPQRRIFRELAVFVGGFDIAAALAVVDPAEPATLGSLETILSLADKSLIQRDHVRESPRFTMLETVREFALEELGRSGDERDARARHARYYVSLGEQAETHMLREVESNWLDLLEMDHDNLRAALQWTIFGGQSADVRQLGLRLAGALWLFWYYHSHLTEGRWWLEHALTAARPTAESQAARAKALVGLGTLAHAQGDGEHALSWVTEGLDLLRSLGDSWGTAFALSVRGNLAEDAGYYDEAETYFSEANALFAAADDGVNVAVTLYHLGVVAFGQGDLELSERRHLQALKISRRSHDTWGAALSLSSLGLVQALRGEVRQSASQLLDALALFTEIGSPERIGDLVSRVAVLAEVAGDHGKAVRLFAAAEGLAESFGFVYGLPEGAVYARSQASAAATLSDRDYAAWREQGYALGLEGAAAEARAFAEHLAAVTPTEAGGIARDETVPPANHQIGPAAGGSRSTATAPVSSAIAPLSQRELDVLRLVANGYSNRQIADTLYISVRTVTTHVTGIFHKLGVGSRTAAVAVAREHNLL